MHKPLDMQRGIRLTCEAAKYKSLLAVAQFVSSRNCYIHAKNFFCGTLLPECNGTHYYEPCEQMCNDFSEKCNLYAFAGESLQCPTTDGITTFGIFNCKNFLTTYGQPTSRCKLLARPRNFISTPQPTRPPRTTTSPATLSPMGTPEIKTTTESIVSTTTVKTITTKAPNLTPSESGTSPFTTAPRPTASAPVKKGPWSHLPPWKQRALTRIRDQRLAAKAKETKEEN